MGRFRFLEQGLQLGRAALAASATAGADLILVDEFGPLELAGEGWRPQVDALLRVAEKALIVVVRRELAAVVREVYAGIPSRLLDALAPASVSEVLQELRDGMQVRTTE